MKTAKKKLPKSVKETAEIVELGGMMQEAALDNTNFIVGKNLE